VRRCIHQHPWEVLRPGLEDTVKRKHIFTNVCWDRRLQTWPRKADLFIMRTDGRSCSRETVKGEAFVELVRMAACCEQTSRCAC
jgi:hypothetical protein